MYRRVPIDKHIIDAIPGMVIFTIGELMWPTNSTDPAVGCQKYCVHLSEEN